MLLTTYGDEEGSKEIGNEESKPQEKCPKEAQAQHREWAGMLAWVQACCGDQGWSQGEL
jgi:hypothetical protein